MHHIKGLSVILLLQVLLVIGFSMSGQDSLAVFTSDEPVFNFQTDQVKKITIQGEDETLEMHRTKDGWELPSVAGFPGDSKKIDGFLATVHALRKTWPVARSKEALKPLKVADDSFERKIDFSADDSDLATLYLGSSPGFKKVHARAGGTPLVYAIEMNTFELPATSDAWTDKEYLYVDQDSISEITLPNLKIVRSDAGFTLADIAENEKPIEKEMDALAAQVAKIHFVKVLGKDAPEGYAALEKKITFSLKLKDGTEKQFEGRGLIDESFYILKESTTPFYFKVSKGLFDRLEGATRSTVVTVAEESPEAPTEQGASESEAPAATE